MKNGKSLPKVFCPVPFASLILNPNGHVGSCRELGIGHVLGNIHENTIEEIWNNKKFRDWRLEFLTGNIVTCKEYINHNSCNKLHSNLDLLPYIDASEVVKTPILRLSPDINGFCNLQCPFCNIWARPNHEYDKIDGFWEHLKKHIIPNLIQIDPLAGEPFLQPDLYKIINLAADSNPALSWRFTTNAQWSLSESIKSHLRKIKINRISVSLDTVDPKTYESIRAPGKLGNALKTIDDLKLFQKEKDFHLEINFSIQRENAFQIIEMLNFCEENNLFPFVQYVYSPENLSPSTLGLAQRKKILKYYFSKMSQRELLISHRVLRALLETFRNNLQIKYFKMLDLLTEGKFSRLITAASSIVPSFEKNSEV